MNYKKLPVIVSTFFVLNISSSPICACGVTDLGSTPSSFGTTVTFKAIDSLTAFVLEGAKTSFGTIFGSVLGLVVSPLVSVAEIQSEDPSFLPNVGKGVEQLKAQVALGDHSSSCASCTKVSTMDLQELLGK